MGYRATRLLARGTPPATGTLVALRIADRREPVRPPGAGHDDRDSRPLARRGPPCPRRPAVPRHPGAADSRAGHRPGRRSSTRTDRRGASPGAARSRCGCRIAFRSGSMRPPSTPGSPSAAGVVGDPERRDQARAPTGAGARSTGHEPTAGLTTGRVFRQGAPGRRSPRPARRQSISDFYLPTGGHTPARRAEGEMREARPPLSQGPGSRPL